MRWHYTTRPVLQKILLEGVLKPTQYGGADKFRPTLWFSSNPLWEATAAKRIGEIKFGRLEMMSRRLTFEEQHRLLGHARIRAPDDLPLMNVTQWADAIQASPAWFADLVVGGMELGGNPDEWFATFEPLPAKLWAAVERWDGKEWLRV